MHFVQNCPSVYQVLSFRLLLRCKLIIFLPIILKQSSTFCSVCFRAGIGQVHWQKQTPITWRIFRHLRSAKGSSISVQVWRCTEILPFCCFLKHYLTSNVTLHGRRQTWPDNFHWIFQSRAEFLERFKKRRERTKTTSQLCPPDVGCLIVKAWGQMTHVNKKPCLASQQVGRGWSKMLQSK